MLEQHIDEAALRLSYGVTKQGRLRADHCGNGPQPAKAREVLVFAGHAEPPSTRSADTAYTALIVVGAGEAVVSRLPKGIPPRPGTVVRNALSDKEFVQATEIVQERGGLFEGQKVSNEPRIDGTWNGTLASLKEVKPGSANNVNALKSAADSARTSVYKHGYRGRGVHLFIRAHGVSAAEAEGIPHLQRMIGPAFSRISIRTRDRWVDYA